MGFKHGALAAAAADGNVQLLRQAGAKVGAVDPVAALQRIDCNPPGIAENAKEMADASQQVTEAREALPARHRHRGQELGRRGVRRLPGERVRVGRRLRQDHRPAAETAAAGAHISAGLHQLATSSANQAHSIAAKAAPSSQLVLRGPGDPGGGNDPERRAQYAQAEEEVRASCQASERVVQRNVQQIPPLGDSIPE
ncbi:MAG: hypothetical protein GEV03_26620 [Streptosporangiales bacterium]|nr:hypothetical protein [Streptosporangiales bacterium]